MRLATLNSLSDGARIYLVPVGPVFRDDRAVPLAGSGLMFSGFRVLARDEGGLLFDERATVDEVKSIVSELPRSLAGQLLAQLSGLAVTREAIPLENTDATLHFTRPLIMGVLNVTPDSFSDGGKFADTGKAVVQAERMISEGADIIDIGGESTRPGAEPVWEGEEADRVVPVIEALKDKGIPLSIDTRHSFVMEKALLAGAHIINDVTALTYDPESLAVAANFECPVVLMHSQGEPKTMQENPVYKNTLLDVYDYLAERVKLCEAAGISKSRIILDPGIGFGKRMIQDNLSLINGLPLLHTLGCPILFGASRKSFIGAISGEEDPSKRLPGSLASAMKAVELGAQIVRVHDVAETKQALSVVQAFRDAAIMDVSE